MLSSNGKAAARISGSLESWHRLQTSVSTENISFSPLAHKSCRHTYWPITNPEATHNTLLVYHTNLADTQNLIGLSHNPADTHNTLLAHYITACQKQHFIGPSHHYMLETTLYWPITSLHIKNNILFAHHYMLETTLYCPITSLHFRKEYIEIDRKRSGGLGWDGEFIEKNTF